MSETNLEHYKKELGKIFYEGCGKPAAMFGKIKNNCDSDICLSYGQTYADAVLDWMAQPYKKHILDKVEREYLKAVIRPFRNKIDTISKFKTWDGNSQYIYIMMKDNNYSSFFTCFPKRHYV